MWYKLYITKWDKSVIVRYVDIESKWDLYAVIGWLHSTTIEKIERIDYECKDPCHSSMILRPPKEILQKKIIKKQEPDNPDLRIISIPTDEKFRQFTQKLASTHPYTTLVGVCVDEILHMSHDNPTNPPLPIPYCKILDSMRHAHIVTNSGVINALRPSNKLFDIIKQIPDLITYNGNPKTEGIQVIHFHCTPFEKFATGIQTAVYYNISVQDIDTKLFTSTALMLECIYDIAKAGEITTLLPMFEPTSALSMYLQSCPKDMLKSFITVDKISCEPHRCTPVTVCFRADCTINLLAVACAMN